jgi:hypothetical protein
MTRASCDAPGSEGMMADASGKAEYGVHGVGALKDARVRWSVGESRRPSLRAGEGKALRARGRSTFRASAFDEPSEGPM